MPKGSSRRTFLKTSSGLLAAGAVAPALGALAHPHVAGNDLLKVGLIGCGGRGTGAAREALRADENTRLVAMGDAFQDHLELHLRHLLKSKDIAARVDVPKERQFVGFDAYEKVMDSGVDVVILTTPPHFRPIHLAAAVERGLHVFAEKPVAVDAPGLRSVMASCKKAKEKKLSLVSGLCFRYHDGRRAIMQQIHQGRIGKIVSMQANYNTGYLKCNPRKPEWSEMEYQLRNWWYYTWLSGDHITEQHIHSLDVLAWAMGDVYPMRALSLGGRQQRVEPVYGHIYDHFATTYEFPGGVKGFSFCRQQKNCERDVSDHIMGTEGTADIFEHEIRGERPWKFEGKARYMYQNEHDELFASIRDNKPINNGDYMCNSTLMAIMGRMSAYTGRAISWQQAMDSKEDLSPQSYEWGEMEVPPVAMPGSTKFV